MESDPHVNDLLFVARAGAGRYWFSVRTVTVFNEGTDEQSYEERVVLMPAASAGEAIEKAEREGLEYAEILGGTMLPFAQSFVLADFDEPFDAGVEVFSLYRDSVLDPNDYLDRHFDTGTERQRTAE